MREEQLILNAATELYRIKQHATEKEFSWMLAHRNGLNGLRRSECIYGSMTGDCHSPRALELIRKCSIPVYYSSINGFGKKSRTLDHDPDDVYIRNFTSLEIALAVYKKYIGILLDELAEAESPVSIEGL